VSKRKKTVDLLTGVNHTIVFFINLKRIKQ
jgi:hypothetical protein